MTDALRVKRSLRIQVSALRACPDERFFTPTCSGRSVSLTGTDRRPARELGALEGQTPARRVSPGSRLSQKDQVEEKSVSPFLFFFKSLSLRTRPTPALNNSDAPDANISFSFSVVPASPGLGRLASSHFPVPPYFSVSLTAQGSFCRSEARSQSTQRLDFVLRPKTPVLDLGHTLERAGQLSEIPASLQTS